MTTILNQLKEIKEKFPALTFDNKGYQYISPEIREAHKEQIQQIEGLLRSQFPNEKIVRFDNFKPRPDESFCVRCQTKWSDAFTGVCYIAESDFQENEQNS